MVDHPFPPDLPSERAHFLLARGGPDPARKVCELPPAGGRGAVAHGSIPDDCRRVAHDPRGPHDPLTLAVFPPIQAREYGFETGPLSEQVDTDVDPEEDHAQPKSPQTRVGARYSTPADYLLGPEGAGGLVPPTPRGPP